MAVARRPKAGFSMTGNTGELLSTIAHHDAAIASLGGRIEGVETGLVKLNTEVHSGFATLVSKLDRMEAAPKFDFHRTVGTVLSISVLFSMVVAGIVWVTTNQFAGVNAEQKAFNERTSKRLERHDDAIDQITAKLPWLADVRGGKK